MALTFKNGEKILTRTEADCYLYSDIAAIEQSGFVDINPRPKYADGVPAYTKSLNHRVRSYDLSTGEFIKMLVMTQIFFIINIMYSTGMSGPVKTCQELLALVMGKSCGVII